MSLRRAIFGPTRRERELEASLKILELTADLCVALAEATARVEVLRIETDRRLASPPTVDVRATPVPVGERP